MTPVQSLPAVMGSVAPKPASTRAATIGAASPGTAAPPTLVLDREGLHRLEGADGMSLQWISWERRGRIVVTEPGGRVHLEGEQREARGPGRMTLSGDVTRIDPSSFTFVGAIRIVDAPSDRPLCVRNGAFTFRISGRRRYWRLQQMASPDPACAGLADYVDIYF